MIAQPTLQKDEIEAQIERGFLERLDQKLPSLRRFYTQRQWQPLIKEVKQVKRSAIQHGLDQLSALAEEAEKVLPQEANKSRFFNRPAQPQKAHSAVEKLMREMNNLVIETR